MSALHMDDQDPFVTRKDLQVTEANLRLAIGEVRSDVVALDAKVERYASDLTAKIDKQGSDLSARIDKQGSDPSARIDKQGADLTAKVDKQGSDLSTRIDKLGADLSAKIDKQGGDLSAKIDKQGSDLLARIVQQGSDHTAAITALDTKIELMGASLQKSLSRQMAGWSFGLLVAVVGVMVAALFTLREIW